MGGSDDGKTLKLSLEKKCGEKKEEQKCKCNGGNSITASKETNIGGVTHFSKYVHSAPDGITFTLDRQLDGGGQIGSEGVPIEHVQSVAVYYWNENPNEPILLGITTGGASVANTYYARNGKDWNGPVAGAGELDALDEQNCQHNNAIPFNIENSTSGSLQDSKSPCIKSRKITPANDPQNPPGSDYIVTAYNITGPSGKETKISRVTLGGKPVTLSTPSDAITEVRLYSSSVNTNVPIMVSFLKRGGDSKWYESQNKEGTQWGEVGSGKSQKFYADKDNTTPESALSEKIDQVLCSKYDNVTLNLTKSNSQHGHSYCCDEHAGNKGEKGTGRVTVAEVPDPSRSTIFYRHQIKSGYSIAGIYYLNNKGERKRIKIAGLQGSGNDSVKLYTFYDGRIPKLIYVDYNGRDQNSIKGWYKGGTADEWTKVQNTPSESPDEIKESGDDREFEKYVKDLECSTLDLQECPKENAKQLAERRAEETSTKGLEQASGAHEEKDREEVPPAEPDGKPKAKTAEKGKDGSLGGPTVNASTEESDDAGPQGGAGRSEAGGQLPPTNTSKANHTDQEHTPPHSQHTPASDQGGSSKTPWDVISYLLTGTSVVSGLVSSAGFKYYRSHKGDPWVRRVYPIEFLKNVPC